MSSSSNADASGAPARPPPRRRVLRVLTGTIAFVLVLLVGAASTLWWALRSDRGTAWLLSRLPGVEVVGPRGTLLGDFGADALVWRFGDGGQVRLVQLAWHGLALRRSDAVSAWMLVHLDALSVRQAHIVMPRPAQTQRSEPPQHLKL